MEDKRTQMKKENQSPGLRRRLPQLAELKRELEKVNEELRVLELSRTKLVRKLYHLESGIQAISRVVEWLEEKVD
jgi:predicted nuclease with TOPRIM domain